MRPNFASELRQKLANSASPASPKESYARFLEFVLPQISRVLGEQLANTCSRRSEATDMEIFLWAVLAGRRELAAAMWETCETPLHLALQARNLARPHPDR